VYHGQLLLGSCVWADDRILLTGWGQVHIDEAAKLEAGKADIDFMGVLTSTMTETPPAPVRALIDTPPKTSGAYRRALAAALGAVASSDPSTLVPSPPLEATSATAGPDDATVETSYPIPQVPSTAFGSEPPDSTLRSDQGSDVDPICETDEHRPENLAALQGWNVSAEKQPEWLDEDRNEIRESNQYAAPTGEDSWGVGAPPETPKEMNRAGQELPSGMRIHTVHEGAALHPTRNASKTSSFGGLILLVGLPVVAAGLWLAFREPGVDPPKTQDVVSVKSTTSGTKVKLEVSGVPDSTVSTDAHRITADAKIEPGVSRRFELRSSVPVTVRRTKDKKVVCQESETCSLPIYTDSVKTIDTNYTVTHPKYMPKEVNGYDIYDLRSKGYMRIVMAPKEKPVSKKRKKRRRKAK